MTTPCRFLSRASPKAISPPDRDLKSDDERLGGRIVEEQ
jgi:hypothetical protein